MRRSLAQPLLRFANHSSSLPYLGAIRHPSEARSSFRNAQDDRRLFAWMRSVLEPTSNCIDLGANRGRHLWHISRAAPKGRHLAVEPIAALADALRAEYPDVRVVNAAVSDRDGARTFYVVPQRRALSGFYSEAELGAEAVEVRVTTLDALVDPAYPPCFIKIDVEGEELAVVRGGATTIERYRPSLAFECGTGTVRRHGLESVKELFVRLAGVGYEVYDLKASHYDERRFLDAVAARENWNWLALIGNRHRRGP